MISNLMEECSEGSHISGGKVKYGSCLDAKLQSCPFMVMIVKIILPVAGWFAFHLLCAGLCHGACCAVSAGGRRHLPSESAPFQTFSAPALETGLSSPSPNCARYAFHTPSQMPASAQAPHFSGLVFSAL